MAPLTKDSVEVANPAGDAAAAQAGGQAKPASAMRSDALSLEVAVKVHGSRVIEVARGAAPKTEPFEEQTVTMIVFPNGAVLRMSTTVNVSQMLVLTNIKTKLDSICRVLKVRPNSNQGSYVEVEFTNRQPGYWGIQFASESSAAPRTIAPPKVDLESQARPPLAAAPPPQIPVAPVSRPAASANTTLETKPAAAPPAPAPFAASPKPESSFISIGSQEKVQDAATATVSTTRPLSPVERRLENPAPPISKNVAAVEASPAPPATPPSVSMDDLLGDDPGSSSSVAATATASLSATTASPSEDKSEAAPASPLSQSSREVFGNLVRASSAAPQAEPSETFGARLDASLGTSAAKNAGAGKNWFLIAACVAVVVAGLAAGAVYFRQHLTNGSAPAARVVTTTPQPVSGGSSQLPAITPPGQPYAAGVVEPNQPARPSAGVSPAVTAPANPSSDLKAPTTSIAPATSHPATPAKQTTPGVTPDMMSNALTARPTTSSRGDEGQADQAPVLDPGVSASTGSALPGISAPNGASLPSPEMRPEGPVKIGGNVKEPQLINSVMPQYPPAARASGQQGDVVIETTINQSGNVVRMHVISGPTGLRAAAMEALRRWKYEPSRLDGEPVEVQMQVTIKFRI